MECHASWIKALAPALLGIALCPLVGVKGAEGGGASFPTETEDLLGAAQAAGLEEFWLAEQGDWEMDDGLLRGHIDGSGCAAISMRSPLERNDYALEVRFRLVEGAKGFHVVFPSHRVDGEVDGREGSIYSVAALAGATKILRHRDPANPGDQNRTLAETFHPREAGQWQTVAIRCSGGEVSVTIEGLPVLRATHPDFVLKSGAPRLRAVGGTLEIGELLLHVPVPAENVD